MLITLLAQSAAASEDYEDACQRWARHTGVPAMYAADQSGAPCPGFLDATRQPGADFAGMTEDPRFVEYCGGDNDEVVELGLGRRAACRSPIAAVLSADVRCSGVLVAPDAVLTAAHCADADEVVFGRRLKTGVEGYLSVEVRAAVHHPDRRVDAAIVFLADAVALDPVPWRTGGEGDLPPQIYVDGFGSAQTDCALYGSKLMTRFNTENLVECTSLPGIGCRTGDEFIVLGVKGIDTACGDSGAPVLEPIGDGWRIVGITSRSLPGGSVGEGGIYQYVHTISPWIVSEIRKHARSR